MKPKVIINWREVLSLPEIPAEYEGYASDWSTCAVGQIDHIEKKKCEVTGSFYPVDDELTILGCRFAGAVQGVVNASGDHMRGVWRKCALRILGEIEKRAEEVRI